jgi:hypothetical protein
MNYYQKAVRVIKRLVDNGKDKFIIFPFGERGMLIKNILNQCFGIEEVGIIDNGLCKTNNSIKDLSALNNYDLNDCCILLSSDTDSCYSEIRYQLMKCATIEQFVDVFSSSMFFDPEVYYEKPSSKHPRIIALEF